MKKTNRVSRSEPNLVIEIQKYSNLFDENNMPFQMAKQQLIVFDARNPKAFNENHSQRERYLQFLRRLEGAKKAIQIDIGNIAGFCAEGEFKEYTDRVSDESRSWMLLTFEGRRGLLSDFVRDSLETITEIMTLAAYQIDDIESLEGAMSDMSSSEKRPFLLDIASDAPTGFWPETCRSGVVPLCFEIENNELKFNPSFIIFLRSVSFGGCPVKGTRAIKELYRSYYKYFEATQVQHS